MNGGIEGGEMRVGTREIGEEKGDNSDRGGGRQWSGEGNRVVLGWGKRNQPFKISPFPTLHPSHPASPKSTHGWKKKTRIN